MVEHFRNPLLLHIDGLMQERRNYSALAMELCLSWTNPLIFKKDNTIYIVTEINHFNMKVNLWINYTIRGYFNMNMLFLANIGIPIIKIRQSYDHLIFLGIPIRRKRIFISKWDPECYEIKRYTESNVTSYHILNHTDKIVTLVWHGIKKRYPLMPNSSTSWGSYGALDKCNHETLSIGCTQHLAAASVKYECNLKNLTGTYPRLLIQGWKFPWWIIQGKKLKQP